MGKIGVRVKMPLNFRWSFYSDPKLVPFNVPRKNLAEEFKKKRIKGKKLLQIPSFYFIYQALKKGVTDVGVEGVMNPS